MVPNLPRKLAQPSIPRHMPNMAPSPTQRLDSAALLLLVKITMSNGMWMDAAISGPCRGPWKMPESPFGFLIVSDSSRNFIGCQINRPYRVAISGALLEKTAREE